jgi:Nif-specific regulatory protein
VLISGETGTGKELVANAIHYNSPRKSGPMVSVNCGAIPGELMEREFFGHVKGAFTGAVDSSNGYFAEADRGTLLLDEIGEMDKDMQVKLLRVLERGEMMRVGDSKPTKVDVRLIAATNKNLLAEVQKGNFREDLYYRIHVIPFHLPPLRQRTEDLKKPLPSLQKKN